MSQVPGDAPDPPLVPLDQQERLAADVPCIRCGYNLRGLAIDANCPECGAEVAYSIKGDGLAYANPHWVTRLARGSTLILISELLIIPLPCCLFSLLHIGDHLIGAITLIPPLCTTFGFWLCTTPEPARMGTNENRIARLGARWGCMAAFCLHALAVGEEISGSYFLDIGIALLAAFSLYFAACFCMAHRAAEFARRLRDESLAVRFRDAGWCLVAGILFLLLVGVWLTILTYRLNEHLHVAAQQAWQNCEAHTEQPEEEPHASAGG